MSARLILDNTFVELNGFCQCHPIVLLTSVPPSLGAALVGVVAAGE